MNLRCMVRRGRVPALVSGLNYSMGSLIDGAIYRVVDEEGREVENISQIDVEVPFDPQTKALYAEVRIKVPVEIEE